VELRAGLNPTEPSSEEEPVGKTPSERILTHVLVNLNQFGIFVRICPALIWPDCRRCEGLGCLLNMYKPLYFSSLCVYTGENMLIVAFCL